MEVSHFHTLIEYFFKVLPALGIAVLFWFTVKPDPKLRIGIYILLFVLFRDAMTGAKLWSFGVEGGFWIRLGDSPFNLILLGFLSLTLVAGLWKFDIENRKLVLWFRGNKLAGALAGILSALLISSPVWALNVFYSSANLKTVSSDLLLPLFWFAICGNLYEEFLFRGYVRGLAEEKYGRIRAALISGTAFAFFHIYLAVTVSSVGFPLLLFTLWEGIICGLLASRWGIYSSTIAHGGAIWIISSGYI